MVAQIYPLNHNVATARLRMEESFFCEFPEDINFFEKMLELHKMAEVRLDWLEAPLMYGAKIDEVAISARRFYLRMLEDMLLFYEIHFVGDDDLSVISIAVNWAIDNKDEDFEVESVLREVVVFLEKKNVVVDLERGGVVKTMCEIIEAHQQTGSGYRCREQMAFVLCDDNESDEYSQGVIEDVYALWGSKNAYDSHCAALRRNYIVTVEKEKPEKEEFFVIDEYNPVVMFQGSQYTLNGLLEKCGVKRCYFDELRKSGVTVEFAFKVCLIKKALRKVMHLFLRNEMLLLKEKMNLLWVDFLQDLVALDIKILKLCYYPSLKLIVACADEMGVSIDWVRSRLSNGMTVEGIIKERDIMEGRLPMRNWEDWCIQRPNMIHPFRKWIRVSDLLSREGILKKEVEKEIGRRSFNIKDIGAAIIRIVKRRRANGLDG